MKWLRKYFSEIIIFVIFLSLYSFTASRTLTLGDTGEFLTAASVGGVVHDPAYPLYSLILWLIYKITFGYSAYILNLSSALFATITLILTFKITRHITKNIPASFFAVMSLGTYEFFWFYAQVVQVHIFHVFLLSFLFYFLVLLLLKKEIKYLYLSGLVFGLGASHSQTIIFALPSLLLAMFYIRKKLSLKILLKLCLITPVGLLSYLYVVIASSQNPAMNWGGIHDLPSLLFVVFRGNYGSLKLTAHTVMAPFEYSSFLFYFKSIIYSSWFVILPALFSAKNLRKKDPIFIVLLLAFLLLGPFYYLIMNQRAITITHWALIDQYIPYSFIFISIFAGIGFNLLLKKLGLTNKIYAFLIIFLIYAIPLIQTFNKVSLHNNNFIHTTTKFIFSELPKNAIILTGGDSLYFPGMYLQNFEKLRPDITIIQLGQLSPWYEKQLKEEHPELIPLISGTKFNFPLACEMFAKDGRLYLYPWFVDFDNSWGKKCENIPYGLVAKVVPSNKVPKIEEIKKFNDEEFNKYISLFPQFAYKSGSTRTRQALFDVAEHINTRGLYYQNKGKIDWAITEYKRATDFSYDETYSLSNEGAIYFYKGDFQKAIDLMEEGTKRSQINPKLYYALGFAYGKLGNEEKAYQNFQKFMSFEPTGDPQIPLIKKFLKDYEAKSTGVKSSL